MLEIKNGTSDDITYEPMRITAGATATSIKEQTTTGVSTGGKIILIVGNHGSLVVVNGNNGASYFSDLIFASYGGTPTTVSQHTAGGSPASRTYAIAGGGNLQLTMGSGTYAIHAFSIQPGTR